MHHITRSRLKKRKNRLALQKWGHVTFAASFFRIPLGVTYGAGIGVARNNTGTGPIALCGIGANPLLNILGSNWARVQQLSAAPMASGGGNAR